MLRRSVVEKLAVGLVERSRTQIHHLQRRIDPRYREVYRFELSSLTPIDCEQVVEVLENEIPDDADIEVKVADYSWFSVKQLEPREAVWHCIRNDGPHSQAEATVLVAVSSEWETAEEMIPDLRKKLLQFASASVEMEPSVHEPLSELEIDRPRRRV